MADETLGPGRAELEQPDSSLDQVASFLSQHRELFEPKQTPEEKNIQRVRSIEARLVELGKLKDLKSFFKAHVNKTDIFFRNIPIVFANEDDLDSALLFFCPDGKVKVLLDGKSVWYSPYSRQGTEIGGNVKWEFVGKTQGTLNINVARNQSDKLGSISFFSPTGPSEMKSLAFLLETRQDKGFIQATAGSITKNLVNGLEIMAKEMQQPIAPLSPSFPPPPAASRPAGPTSPTG